VYIDENTQVLVLNTAVLREWAPAPSVMLGLGLGKKIEFRKIYTYLTVYVIKEIWNNKRPFSTPQEPNEDEKNAFLLSF